MTITNLICCLVVTLVSSGLAVACYYGGRSDQKEDKKAPIICMCIVSLVVFALISFGASYFIAGGTFGEDMIRRLNAPIVSSQQLYGYEIVGKKTQKGESSQTYFIDIKDLLELPYELRTPVLLRDIEISEEFFQELEVGQCFPPELAIDPNAPTKEQ